MQFKHILCLFFASFFCLLGQSKDVVFMTGLLPDDGTYDQLARKNELLTRDYSFVPSSHSLLQYCPEVKSQSQYGTCTSWATAYAARTIAEAVKYGWTDKEKITNEAFSPLFVYALIKDRARYPYDNDCQEGTCIYNALQLMKDKGVPKYSSFDVLCANNVSESLYPKARHYKIDDFFTLFSSLCIDENEKIRKVKKSLSEDCPVVIAMHIPHSFFSAGKTWGETDVNPAMHGYHAMCVVGYDNNRDGGAFHVMNSWGSDWADDGFVWIKYADFAKFVDQAYEIYVKKDYPRPYKTESDKSISLAGKIELLLSTGEWMVGTKHIKEGINSYHLNDSYVSGTRYRLYISNNEPAYVYVIGSDLTNAVGRVFPPTDKISAALTYKANHIAIPDERYYIEMDNTIGTDYMCVLYSKNVLDINAIMHKMESVNGSIYQRLKTALGDELISSDEIYTAKNEMTFKAQSNQTIVPIVVEIPHK